MDREAMLKAHNQVRKQVGVEKLIWSNRLEKFAKNYAEELKRRGCNLVHNPARGYYGENLFKASPIMWADGYREPQKITPAEVVYFWADESRYYNYQNNSCNGVCSHYTQIVWRDTKKVGCAVTLCDDKSQIWICNYSPAGNIIGEKPY